MNGDAVAAVLFDIGGTLVEPAPPATAVADLRPSFRPGALHALRALAHNGIRLAAVTDTTVMGEAEVRSVLGSAVGALLEVIVTSVDVGVAKPDPAGVRRALAQLGCPPDRAVLVGDHEVDRLAAGAAGVDFVLADPKRHVDRVLLEYLAGRLGPFAAARLLVGPLDADAAAAADQRQGELTKPPGSLGRLEGIGAQLAAIAGCAPPPVPIPTAVTVFAGDHGVLARGVSPWPQEVTAQMVANFCAGGAAINVLARAAGASVTVVDVGVATPIPPVPTCPGGPVFLDRRIHAGTADLSEGPAMAEMEAIAALDIGAEVALAAVAEGAGVLLAGDMGIGNTTPSAALIAAFTGRPALDVTGRGTGIDDLTFDLKTAVIGQAVARAGEPGDPLRTVAELGGLEHAAIAGYIVAGAAAGVPVIVDGVIALAALLVAEALVPGVSASTIAGHRSAEPGATVALDHLGLRPLLDLDLRLGEGTGAVLALPLVQAAALILREMATFASAGLAGS